MDQLDFRMNSHTAKALAVGLVLSFFVSATAAYAQAPPGMTQVSGTYTNAATGVQMTFPDGWSGFEIVTANATLVPTSPGGMSENDPATMKTITLLMTAKIQNQDPTEPSSFNNDVQDCNDPAIQSRTVAGVQAVEATVECPSTSQKFTMVSVETASNWVIVMYMAPMADFDSNVADFDSAVSSLQVQGAMNTQVPSGGGGGGSVDEGGSGGVSVGLPLQAAVQTVVIAGANVNLDVKTNSTISNFELDEEDKQISFTVDGQTGTRGSTEIPIGKVLEGPYTVMIDGSATTDFEVANEGSTDAVMTLSYTHSQHDVDVTGTNVVPEFPIAIVGIIAAVIGAVAVLSRTNLMGNFTGRKV